MVTLRPSPPSLSYLTATTQRDVLCYLSFFLEAYQVWSLVCASIPWHLVSLPSDIPLKKTDYPSQQLSVASRSSSRTGSSCHLPTSLLCFISDTTDHTTHEKTWKWFKYLAQNHYCLEIPVNLRFKLNSLFCHQILPFLFVKVPLITQEIRSKKQGLGRGKLSCYHSSFCIRSEKGVVEKQ